MITMATLSVRNTSHAHIPFVKTFSSGYGHTLIDLWLQCFFLLLRVQSQLDRELLPVLLLQRP